MRGGKLAVIGNGVVIDPWALVSEIETLRGQGVDLTSETLRIAENATLILPVHQDLDALREKAAGKGKIGTTKRGIGPAYEDKVGRRSIRMMDLLDLDALPAKVDRLLTHHNALRRGMGEAELVATDILDQLKEIAPKVTGYIEPVWKLLDDARRKGKRILFEGAQGVLLDIDHGTYPYVTSSNTTVGGIFTGSGVAPKKLDYILAIIKAYTTRVGSGPFMTELFDDNGKQLAKIGHELGATTGRERRCGWLDLVALKR